ncbi:MAG: hypothetical protein ACJ748_00050, partial [Flavisolibacter sp.]
EMITWVLFLAWTSTRYTMQQQNVAMAFLIFFFILFAFSISGNRLINKKPVEVNDTYFLVLNLLAFYLGSLFVFGSRFSDTNIALITFFVSVFYGLQAFVYHFIMRNEFILEIFSSFQ